MMRGLYLRHVPGAQCERRTNRLPLKPSYPYLGLGFARPAFAAKLRRALDSIHHERTRLAHSATLRSRLISRLIYASLLDFPFIRLFLLRVSY